MPAPGVAVAASIASRGAAPAAAGFCAGAAAAQLVGSSAWPAGGAGLCLATAAVLWRTERSRPAATAALLAIAALAAQVGAWRTAAAEEQLAGARANVQRFSGPQQIRGLIADEPLTRGQTTSLILSDVLVREGDEWLALGASVRVSVPHWPAHDYGEYLQLRGTLRSLAGGAAVEALGRRGVLASMSYPRISNLANPQANAGLIELSQLRRRLGESIDQTLPEPAASTLKATVLGLRGALSKDEQQALVDTGTVHLVVISGFKLSLLAAMLEAVGLWLLRRTTARLWARAAVSLAVLGLIGGYTALTGATPSAERAALMAGLAVLAALAGRPREQLAALAIAVLAIAAWRPLELQDAGFQLSCLSVLGIVLLAQPLGDWIRRPFDRLPAEGWPARAARAAGLLLAEAGAASIAATAFAVPVLASSFHEVSLVSPLANLLGMPLLGPIMVLGGAGAIAGALWAPVGGILLWPAWAFTSLLDWLVHWSAGLPYAALAVDEMPLAATIFWFGLLLLAAWLLAKTPGTRPPRSARAPAALRWAALSAGAAAVAVIALFTGRPPAVLQATLLAVPGQAALIQTPGGLKILIDGGEDGAALLRQLGQLLPPWDRRLDVVLITSPRADHVGALDAVFARYAVGAVVAPDMPGPLSFRRLEAVLQRPAPDVLDLGDGARLAHEATGWRLRHGSSWLLISDRGFDLSTPEGSRHVSPAVRGLQPTGTADELLLTDAGNLAVRLSLE